MLKPCPCGETPTTLLIMSNDQICPKWAYVSGDCCETWEVEYRNDRHKIGTPEAKKLAEDAWNEAPRAEDDEKT